MRIPQDQKYWELCATICLINTLIEYLHIDIKQISNLIKIEQALNEAQNFDLKVDSIKILWKKYEIKNKTKFWDWLSEILYQCELWDNFFYYEFKKIYINSIYYSHFISRRNAENKPAYLIEIKSTDNPEILLEKYGEKFLLVSAFSEDEKIMYYFKKNSWFVLGDKEEKTLAFRPEMCLLYIKLQDNSIIEDICYAKQLLILDNKNCYGEHVINYIENFSNFMKQEMNSSLNQEIESKTRDIERLAKENKDIKESLDEASSEIVKLKSEIDDLKQQLSDKDKAAIECESVNKELKEELSGLKENYGLLSTKHEQLIQAYNNLSSKYSDFSKAIKQVYLQFNPETLENNYLSGTELVRNNQSCQQRCESSINPDFHLEENKTPIFYNIKQGLPNLGNTCYLSSILQIFASTNNLYEIITTKNDNLSIALSKVLSVIRMGDIESLLKSLKSEIDATFSTFTNWEQQDSKELLVSLLDSILDQNTRELFSFRYNEKLPCNKCGGESIMPREEIMKIIPSSETSIKSFFNKIKEPKTIQGDGLRCDFCSQNGIFKAEIVDVTYPDHIILYLPNPERFKRSAKFLEDNLVLDRQSYSLYGVICYYRHGNGGHYTAFTKDMEGWVEYNDHVVRHKAFNQNDAYLAFYSVCS